MFGLLLMGFLLTVLVTARGALTWAWARRSMEPRAGVSRSGMRWYEPWPARLDYPDATVWRVAVLGWLGFHGAILGQVATTVWLGLRASA